jgi:PKD repeat protein
VVEHTFASAGTFTVELTASNCDGASTDTVSYPVEVPIPVELMHFSVD